MTVTREEYVPLESVQHDAAVLMDAVLERRAYGADDLAWDLYVRVRDLRRVAVHRIHSLLVGRVAQHHLARQPHVSYLRQREIRSLTYLPADKRFTRLRCLVCWEPIPGALVGWRPDDETGSTAAEAHTTVCALQYLAGLVEIPEY